VRARSPTQPQAAKRNAGVGGVLAMNVEARALDVKETWAEAQRGHHRRSEFLEHVDGETFSIRLLIQAGPKAIHLIALDTVNSH
jgi:hypothetical protein